MKLSRTKYPVLPPKPTIQQVQEYIEKTVEYRGFEGDDVVDSFLILADEMGKLAKAVRVYDNFRIATNSKIVDLQYEIVDTFRAFVHVANQLEVDLESALRVKEEEDKTRVWVDGLPI